MNRDALIRALWQPPPEHDPTDEEILTRCMWLERTEKLEANQGPTLAWYRRLADIVRRHLATQEALLEDHRMEHGRREQRAKARRIRSRIDLLRGILEEWEADGAPGSVREPTP